MSNTVVDDMHDDLSPVDRKVVKVLQYLASGQTKAFRTRLMHETYVADEYHYDEYDERLLDVDWYPNMGKVYSETVFEAFDNVNAEKRIGLHPGGRLSSGGTGTEPYYVNPEEPEIDGDVFTLRDADVCDDVQEFTSTYSYTELVRMIKDSDQYQNAPVNSSIRFR